MTERQFDAKMKALISEYIAWMPESYLDELMQAIEQRREAIQRRVMTPIEIPAWPKQTGNAGTVTYMQDGTHRR